MSAIGLSTPRVALRVPLSTWLRRLWKAVPFVLVAVWVAMIAWPGLFTAANPDALNPLADLAAPSSAHWFGTDEAGRDIFARCVYGVRDSVGVSICVVFVAAAVGVLLGGLAGLGNRFVDNVVMRSTDVFLSFPYLILAIAIAAAVGPGMSTVFIALVAVWWPSYARTVRGQILVLRELPFVEGAHAVGTPLPRIFVRHMLPHLASQLYSRIAIDVGYAILALTGLSFLGLGAQPPTPELGSMIADARNYTLVSWWYATLPGVFVLGAVATAMIVGSRLERGTRGGGR